MTKKIISNEFLFRYFINSNNKKQWVDASQISRDIDLSERVIYQGNEFILKEVKGYWAVLESPQDGHKDWVPFFDLSPSPEDLGMALTLIPTSLREGPTWSSQLLTTMPGKTRLRILTIKDSWLKVLYVPQPPTNSQNTTPAQIGFVDLNNVLLKADFANQIMDESNQWQKVKYREGFLMLLENKKMIPISKVKQWNTDHSMAIITSSDESKRLLLRQTSQIEKTESQVWTVSHLKDHGKVFWKRPLSSDLSVNESTLHKEDLLQREIYSVSWSPQNHRIGLVSSNGIYATKDGGETWALLPQFKTENSPVSISPDGTWFVGPLKSKDLGKTFSNYIRIDRLAQLIQSQTTRAPRSVKIAKIDFKNSHMEIVVDTGGKRLRLATKSHEDLITQWDILN